MARRSRSCSAAACGCCRWRSRWRRRADLRRAVPGRRQPHDGVDRGAARADRPRGGLRDPVPRPLRRGATRAARPALPAASGLAAAAGGPTILTAGLATAVGFLVLLLSPVPMVRGFGAAVVLGIGWRCCALCAGFAAAGRVRCRPQRRRRARGRRACGLGPGAWPAPASGSPTAPGARSAWRCANRAGAGDRPGSGPRRPGSTPRARSSPTCASSCPRPAGASTSNELQEATGVGEIDVTVRAADITDPEVIAG